jgi:hypothetical protein
MHILPCPFSSFSFSNCESPQYLFSNAILNLQRNEKTMLLEDASGKLLELHSKLQERIHISTLGDAPICSQIYSGAVGGSDVW